MKDKGCGKGVVEKRILSATFTECIFSQRICSSGTQSKGIVLKRAGGEVR